MKKETSIIGKMGWAVNSILIKFKSSNLLFPNVILFNLKKKKI